MCFFFFFFFWEGSILFLSLVGNATFQRQFIPPTVHDTPAIDLGEFTYISLYFFWEPCLTLSLMAFIFFLSPRSFTHRKNLSTRNLPSDLVRSPSRAAILGTAFYIRLLHGSLREARTTGLRQRRCLRQLRSVSQKPDQTTKTGKTVSVYRASFLRTRGLQGLKSGRQGPPPQPAQGQNTEKRPSHPMRLSLITPLFFFIKFYYDGVVILTTRFSEKFFFLCDIITFISCHQKKTTGRSQSLQ